MNINAREKRKQRQRRRRNGPRRGGAVAPPLCFWFKCGKPSWGAGCTPHPRGAGPGGHFGSWPGEGRRERGKPEGPAAAAAAAASDGARLCPPALAGPGPHGGVVLPPAWLQIAVAAGPGEGERGAAGRGPLPLGRSAGKPRGQGCSGARRGQKRWLGLAAGEGCPAEILHSSRTQNLLNLHQKVIRNLLAGPGADCQGRGLQSPSGLHNT